MLSSTSSITYLCEDTPDGLLSAIYQANADKVPLQEIHIRTKNQLAYELFVEYREVVSDYVCAVKVMDAINRHISRQAGEMVYSALLSCAEDRGDQVLRFILKGFRLGGRICDMLALSEAADLFELQRNVNHEAHYFREFLRFSQSEQGILFAQISPKSNVLPLIAPYFTDRLPSENFVIFADSYELTVIHPADSGWYLAPMKLTEFQRVLVKSMEETGWEACFKAFHQSIAIKERNNPVCQRTHLPLWYRKHMTEFN
ncbi:MAG: TIGR03915 family putative DNA repair protein [Lachnospiraceae bacterium]|nr:TIGR03915 family putative DNA repair protein [Lachnospiraceae bacterium]